jgi:aspartate/glutamate racemase
MDNRDIQEAAVALREQWDLQLPELVSEEQILAQLTRRVIVLLERGPESFFQLMYRLDISEKKLNAVMNEEDVAERIARLIYERQMQKIHSRHTNKKSEPYDPELSW